MLKEKIIEQIRKTGPISFYDFMEMALYDPDGGYYTTSAECIGVEGDFYTTSSLTPIFGALIGRQLEEMWRLLGQKEFTIVEYGAGTGLLCRDILAYLESNSAMDGHLKYCIIERSPVMQKKQAAHLQEKVCWLSSIAELGPFSGCVFSNELVDNFSIHQVVMHDELAEIYVDCTDQEQAFKEILKPASHALINYFRELDVQLPKGFRTEVNLGAIGWIREIAATLERGFVMTIDYGYSSPELYGPSRSNGTLLCYHQHSINDDPYGHIGRQDITTHVNFSALCHWGLQNGLLCNGLVSQAEFLLSLGLEEYLSKYLLNDPRKYLFLKQKLLLDMGTRFKVLIQEKNIPGAALTGMRFASDRTK